MKSKVQKIKENSRNNFDKQAISYDSASYGEHARSLYDYVIQMTKQCRHESVLDVGCGTGKILYEIWKEDDVRVSGIDISEEMVKMAIGRLGEGADIRRGDSEHLPWHDNTFDVVLCTDSFHHYPRPEIVLAEMKRVLSDGGKIIIADLWFPAPVRQIANVIMPLTSSGDVCMYSEASLKKLLTKCGLQCVKWNKIDNNSFAALVSL